MRTLRRRWWTLLDDEQGMTLVEVIAAMFVLSVALFALAGVATTTLGQLSSTRDREQATNAASAAIERVRARDFQEVVHAADAALTDTSVISDDVADLLDVSDDRCRGDEPLATGAVDDPVALRATVDGFTVNVVVTHAADPPPGCGSDPTGLKRVVAVASWEDADGIERVRQETLITGTERGLPVPEFSVDPPSQALELYATVDRRCVQHTVRNTGTDDGYAWELDNAASREVGTDSMLTHDRAWRVTGYLAPDPVEDLSEDALEDHRMEFESGETTEGPQGDLELATGDTATLVLCYSPGPESTTTTGGDDYIWEGSAPHVVVRSLLDRQVHQVVEHQLELVATQQLYLLDDDDASAHARCAAETHPPDCEIPPMVMRPADEITIGWDEGTGETDSEQRLGQADYTDPDQSDWSTDANEPGGAANPGLRLLASSSSDAATIARWRHQLTEDSLGAGLASVTIDLFLRQPDLVDDETPMVALDVYLDVIDEHELGRTDTLHVTQLQPADQEESPGIGWDRIGTTLHDVGLDLASGDYLQLRVRCASVSEVPCDLAYDNDEYPASVWLEPQT